MVSEIDIIRNILAETARRQWTQEELARRAGIGRNTISNAKNGKSGLKLSKLLKIANALGIDPRELLEPNRGSGGGV